MSSSAFISRADIVLVDEARAKGASVTGRQLKRWRASGLIPAPERSWLGRGHGSITRYPMGTLDLAITLANLPKKRRHPVLLVLIAFAQGIAIPEERLKWAHASWLDRLEGPIMSQPGDALDRAEATAGAFLPYFSKSRSGRRMLRRARGSNESPQSLVSTALSTLFTVMQTGETPSPESLVEFGAVAGVEEGARKLNRLLGQSDNPGLLTEQLGAALQLFHLSHLRRAFQLADYDRLCATRDLVMSLARWCQDNLSPLLLLSGLADELDPKAAKQALADEPFLLGMVVPLVLTIADRFGGAIEKVDFRPALVAAQVGTEPTSDHTDTPLSTALPLSESI